MTMMVSLDHSPVTEAVFGIIKFRAVAHGTTKVEQARADGEMMGYENGIAQMLAALGTQERVRLMEPLLVNEARKYVAAVEAYKVKIWLRSLKDRWDAGEFGDMSDEDFEMLLLAEFRTLWRDGDDEWFAKQYEPTRRDAVKAGIIEPDSGDAAWIKEELSLFTAMANPLQALLTKLPD